MRKRGSYSGCSGFFTAVASRAALVDQRLQSSHGMLGLSGWCWALPLVETGSGSFVLRQSGTARRPQKAAVVIPIA